MMSSMKLSRDFTSLINFWVDQLIPPIIRDFQLLNFLPFKLLFKNHTNVVMDFKTNVSEMDDKEFSEIYRSINDILVVRDTDLNKDCLDKIKSNILGTTVLEVGCGRGFLSKALSNLYQTTATDIIIDQNLAADNPNIRFITAKMESLPFRNNSYDTVISTHTLEHVLDIFSGISELRRVVRKRLIIVVPCQRPYKYTPDLHLHFFPYPESLLALMGFPKKTICKKVGKDLLYIQDF